MKRCNIEPEPMPAASEPAAAFARLDAVSHKPMGKRELPPDCMTVDEYFDELLELVHQDYARLRSDN